MAKKPNTDKYAHLSLADKDLIISELQRIAADSERNRFVRASELLAGKPQSALKLPPKLKPVI